MKVGVATMDGQRIGRFWATASGSYPSPNQRSSAGKRPDLGHSKYHCHRPKAEVRWRPLLGQQCSTRGTDRNHPPGWLKLPFVHTISLSPTNDCFVGRSERGLRSDFERLCDPHPHSAGRRSEARRMSEEMANRKKAPIFHGLTLYRQRHGSRTCSASARTGTAFTPARTDMPHIPMRGCKSSPRLTNECQQPGHSCRSTARAEGPFLGRAAIHSCRSQGRFLHVGGIERTGPRPDPKSSQIA